MRKILIIEDEPCINFLYSKILETDFEVENAIDGYQALEYANEKKYDLILLDISLPFMNGIEILEKMRETTLNKEVKVIVVSALGMEKYKKEAKELGVKEYLEKPIDLKILKSKIMKWCN